MDSVGFSAVLVAVDPPLTPLAFFASSALPERLRTDFAFVALFFFTVQLLLDSLLPAFCRGLSLSGHRRKSFTDALDGVAESARQPALYFRAIPWGQRPRLLRPLVHLLFRHRNPPFRKDPEIPKRGVGVSACWLAGKNREIAPDGTEVASAAALSALNVLPTTFCIQVPDRFLLHPESLAATAAGGLFRDHVSSS